VTCLTHQHLDAGYIGKERPSRTVNRPKLCEKALITSKHHRIASGDPGNFAALKEHVFRNNPLTTKLSKKSGIRSGKTHPSFT